MKELLRSSLRKRTLLQIIDSFQKAFINTNTKIFANVAVNFPWYLHRCLWFSDSGKQVKLHMGESYLLQLAMSQGHSLMNGCNYLHDKCSSYHLAHEAKVHCLKRRAILLIVKDPLPFGGSAIILFVNPQITLRMLVLDNQEDLQVLKKELQSCFPESLKVYGAVLNICRENPFHQEVLVDSWPSFHVVVARPQREKAPSQTNYFARSCAVFYRELGAYQQLIKVTDAIDWGQEFLLQGLQDGVYQMSQSLAAVKYFSTKLVSQTQVFVLQKPLNLSATTSILVLTAHSFFRLGSEMTFSSLNMAQATLLNDTWSVGGSEQSLHYLTQLISSFPSSCLLDAGGCPVSWVLLDQFGCLTHAYTMPAHRGKGYIQLVIAALAQKLEKMDNPVYGDVLESNTSMKRALQGLGAHLTSCFLFYDLHTPLALQ